MPTRRRVRPHQRTLAVLRRRCSPDDDATDALTKQFAANNAVLTASTTLYTAPSFVENTHQHQHTFDAETARAVAVIRQRHDLDGLLRGDVANGSIHALTPSS